MTVRRVRVSTGELKWEVRFHVNGRGSPRLRRRFDRKVDADEFLMRELNQLRDRSALGIGASTRDATFSGEAELWLAAKAATFSPSHLKRARGILAELEPRYGHLKATRFGPAVLAQIVTDQRDSGRSNATINRKIEVVRAILNHSQVSRRISVNPTVGYKKLPNDGREIDFWEVKEAATFLRFADEKYPLGSPDRWVYTVYFLALNTGMRAGEIWGLQVGDIQRPELILVERQFDRVSKTFRPTKGKKARFVPCNSPLQAELARHVATNRLRSGDTIFRSELGMPICHEVFIASRFKGDVAGAGVRAIRFHDLRHTAITHMIDHRLDIKTVQSIAGHKDIGTTMRYVHLVGDRVKQASRTFCIGGDHSLHTSAASLRLVSTSR